MELEVWPNLVRIAEQQNVPVVVVNGRISERSFSGYKKIKPIAKKIASNGRDVIKKNQGANQKTIDQIEKFLND